MGFKILGLVSILHVRYVSTVSATQLETLFLTVSVALPPPSRTTEAVRFLSADCDCWRPVALTGIMPKTPVGAAGEGRGIVIAFVAAAGAGAGAGMMALVGATADGRSSGAAGAGAWARRARSGLGLVGGIATPRLRVAWQLTYIGNLLLATYLYWQLTYIGNLLY